MFILKICALHISRRPLFGYFRVLSTTFIKSATPYCPCYLECLNAPSVHLMKNLARNAPEVKVSTVKRCIRVVTYVEAGDSELGSPLADPHAWDILESFLTSQTASYGETLQAMDDYLGERFIADEWAEATTALFSGDENDRLSLQNFRSVRLKYVPNNPTRSKDHPPRQYKSIFLDLEAGDEEDEEEEDLVFEEREDAGGVSSRSHTVMQLPAAKHKFSTAVDRLQDKYTGDAPSSSRIHVQAKMYLFHVQRTVTQFMADHLQRNGFIVKVSPWSPGQLYVVSDSPKTIFLCLSDTYSATVKKWDRISEEEAESLERATLKLPDRSWVRVKAGQYKGDVAYVFDPDQSNDFVTVLIPPRVFPYPMAKGSVALFDKSRIPADGSMTDIIRSGIVVGWSFKGEKYYGGLLQKKFLRYNIEQVCTPHPDDIRLHRQSGFDLPFVKKTEISFSLQMLRSGDCARFIRGEFPSEVGTVLAVDHTSGGSLSLEIKHDGVRDEIQARLHDVERVLRVGDEIRVVAGAYLGVEGHILSKAGDMVDVCQRITNEIVQVSQYYLDRRPLRHSLQGQVITQYIEPPPENQTIEIGDYIEVVAGEDVGKSGVVEWVTPGGMILWFRDTNHPLTVENDFRSPRISVPVAMAQRTRLPPTLKFTKERGYDIRPGDSVSVARGPEYLAKGIVHTVDFIQARLQFISDSDQSLLDVPISFVMKTQNVSTDTFRSQAGKEVYIIGGGKKGYRGTLYDVNLGKCTVAVHGQRRTTLPSCDVATQYGMRLNGAILDYNDMLLFCEMRKRSFITPKTRSVTPPPERLAPSRADPGPSTSSSGVAWTSWSDAQDDDPPTSNNDPVTDLASTTPDPWAVDNLDVENIIEAAARKLSEKAGPTSWLQEFSSSFFAYRALFKVAPGVHGGRLHKRLVQTECPDPFVGQDGPAPKGTVAVRCTAKTAGGAMQHYFIPGDDLTPADPRKKGQECFILDGSYRGNILTVSKCNVKGSNVDLKLMRDSSVTVNLRFDQVCVVEPVQA
ncbi:uncharacterized protein F5891DRAFT_989939 [Suillus fuscotomentosus]|uniref:KOW domain-containing protein n=1 Tax=Suillus fuscotomentosus TaxID=1912939 RepID=A0AAD4HBR9_9AGAM|nr:uncharacterized protein F5891DRAFT_989939 [Suillus fuscotomentosus]KAG1884841.1 hypothetical protein F5891DRAFT_989939 [Suillus fuscotomentosus]